MIPIQITEANQVIRYTQLVIDNVTSQSNGTNPTAHFTAEGQNFDLPLYGPGTLHPIVQGDAGIIVEITTQNQGAQAVLADCP
jgi:hypothetical protein